MRTKRKLYKSYTREFKLEAIRRMDESGRPASEIAMELGVRRNQLYKWKDQLAKNGEDAFSGQRGRPKKQDQSELTLLKQDNERLRWINGVRVI